MAPLTTLSQTSTTSTTPPAKISPYSLPDLKATTDDALAAYLDTLRPAITQSHTKTDIRLAVSAVASLIAAAVGLLDWLYGFTATKTFTIIAVCVYIPLNAFVTCWMLYVEKGQVWMGSIDAGSGGKGKREELAFASKSEKYTPVYDLTVIYGAEERKVSASYTKWFTAQGELVEERLREWLASEVPVLGGLDPGRVVKDSGEVTREKVVGEGSSQIRVEVQPPTPDDTFGLGSGNAVASGTASARKGGKRRKV